MALTSLRSLPAWESARVDPKKRDISTFYCADRCGHNAVCIKEELLVWGGYNEGGESFQYSVGGRYCDNDLIWCYSLDSDVWSKHKAKGMIPDHRSGACGVLLWPHWYIFCGHTFDGDVNNMHRLNLITLTWERVEIVGDAISPRDKASAWLYDNRIYCLGGYGVFPQKFLWDKEEDIFIREVDRGWNDQMVYFDPSTNQWNRVSCKGPKPTARAAHSTVCMDDKVFVFGGRHRSSRLNDLHCFDLKSDTWSGRIVCNSASPEGRSWHTVCRISKSELLLYGGFNSDNVPLDDVWLFNVSKMFWSLLRDHTSKPRLWHSMSCNTFGDALIFGGCESNILDQDVPMVTSDKVMLLRTTPFSLERLCLHTLLKHRSRTENQWESLPKPFQEWFLTIDKIRSRKKPQTYQHNTESILGPNSSQLSVLSKEDVDKINSRGFIEYLFHVF